MSIVRPTPQDLIYSARAGKRAVKLWPDYARLAIGASMTRVGREAVHETIGHKESAPPRPYRQDESRVPVQIVTPPSSHYMTTFFDIDPISPTGRYLVVTQVPFIWRIPYPGDLAKVVVIDLQQGTATPVYTTAGWGAQLGANVQWGNDDHTIFCNDVVDGQPTGVRIDLLSGRAETLGGPIYGLTPDKKYSFSGRLDYINAGIPGYGVPEKLFRRQRQSDAQSESDGIWRTDLDTGRSELFLSVNEIVSALPEQDHLRGATYYIFNVKINRQGTRGFVVVFTRNTPKRAGWPPQLVTFDLDGQDIRLAMPDRLWRVGGHHPSWLPDGQNILMNLRRAGSNQMEFVRFGFDGSNMQTVAAGNKGGGHPSINPQYTHLITDAYVSETFLDKNGDVPIRCINLADGNDAPIARAFTGRIAGHRRVDPHPVWSGGGSRVVFNGLVDGKRQVMIADTSGICAG